MVVNKIRRGASCWSDRNYRNDGRFKRITDLFRLARMNKCQRASRCAEMKGDAHGYISGIVRSASGKNKKILHFDNTD